MARALSSSWSTARKARSPQQQSGGLVMDFGAEYLHDLAACSRSRGQGQEMSQTSPEVGHGGGQASLGGFFGGLPGHDMSAADDVPAAWIQGVAFVQPAQQEAVLAVGQQEQKTPVPESLYMDLFRSHYGQGQVVFVHDVDFFLV
jgi:hypothetical protein